MKTSTWLIAILALVVGLAAIVYVVVANQPDQYGLTGSDRQFMQEEADVRSKAELKSQELELENLKLEDKIQAPKAPKAH